jgi:signal transduction histidine kinase
MSRTAQNPKSSISRRLWIASLVFGLFVLCNLALFGWLIFKSLSQREVEKVLLDTKAEAELLARQIAGRAEGHGRDLYTAVASERETRTLLDQVLEQREIVRTVVIRDKNGALVFEGSSRFRIHGASGANGAAQHQPSSSPTVTPPPALGARELSRRIEPRPHTEVKAKDWSETFEVPDIQVPIGDLGQLQIGISSGELRRRVGELRRDLIWKATSIGSVSMLFLIIGFVAIWMLLRRSHRLEVKAAEAEKLAYLGTLASGLAHEIRNPLNSLNLNMQMLEEELGDHRDTVPSRRRLLSITRSEISRLERLVTDFLAYAKPRPLELEEMISSRPLDRVREVLAGEIQQRGARVEIEDRSGGSRIRVDAGQINQLLLNLVRNAFAAAEEAGRTPHLKLSAMRDGSHVLLAVRDNGTGVSAEEQERMFDLFYSTRKGGTGLGLAIVQRIAQAHGGRVEVSSARGAGTTVTVELPALAPEAPLRGTLEVPQGA